MCLYTNEKMKFFAMQNKLFSLKSGLTHQINEILFLGGLAIDDVGDDYVEWMNDIEVTRYTEQRFHKTTLDDITSYLEKMAQSPSALFYGIYENSKLIGTIKLDGINAQHLTANLSYLIGSKKHWGQGIATVAIAEMSKVGFNILGLEKISAGVYVKNNASIRVLEKNGFYLDGVRKAQFIYENERIDALWYAKEKIT